MAGHLPVRNRDSKRSRLFQSYRDGLQDKHSYRQHQAGWNKCRKINSRREMLAEMQIHANLLAARLTNEIVAVTCRTSPTLIFWLSAGLDL